MMLSYAEALRRPPPPTPDHLKEFNIRHTTELFRRIKGYDGDPQTVVRQFSCRCCNKMWWTRVRTIKQVSKCKRCKKKYDPIPADLEFGCGKFKCPNCDKEFLGRTQMGRVSTCYNCRSPCFPLYIFNKETEVRDFNLRNRRIHSCEICNGNGRCPTLNEILAYSELHISTGSTLASLLEQTDPEERFIDDFGNEHNDLPSVRESSSDIESNES